MKRDFRLWLNTLHAFLVACYESIARPIRQRTCPHHFRPALVNEQPARICRICDLSEELTRAEFFAQFGERYQGMINQ